MRLCDACMRRESAYLAGAALQQTGVAGLPLQGDDFAPGMRACGNAGSPPVAHLSSSQV